MVQVIRYLKGYVAIRVWGFSPERFMNLCSNHNIFLWDIVNHGEFYTMNISLKGFYQLRSIARKTGTRVVITGRYGLPFLSVKMWKRRVFLAGLLGSLLFWIWMSRFIWSVEIQGNYFVSTDVFEDFLRECEIEAGMKKKDVNIEALEAGIRTEFPVITWTSAKVEGTRLLIKVRENDLTLPIKEEQVTEEGMDLTAEKEGVIVSIVTRAGVPKVTEGTQVEAGDILVEGAVPIMNEDGTVRRYDYCVADADVKLRCTYTYQEKLAEAYEKKLYTGKEKHRRFLMFGTKKLKFWSFSKEDEKWDVVEEKKQLTLFENYALPVYMGKEYAREYTVEERIYSKQEAKVIFEQKIQKLIETLEEKGVQIIQKNVTINKTSGVWHLSVDFLVIESTGKLTETVLEQVEEPQQEETPQ